MFTNIDINQIKKLTQKEFDQFYELEGWSSTLINSRWVLELMTRDDAPALMICDMGEDADFMDMSEFCVDTYNRSQKYYFTCDSENDVISKVYLTSSSIGTFRSFLKYSSNPNQSQHCWLNFSIAAGKNLHIAHAPDQYAL